MSTYGTGSVFAETFPDLDSMMNAIPDNNANLISAKNLRDVSLTLWDGIQGIGQGPQGVQGTQGALGIQGALGFQGRQGPQGYQGIQGSQGLIGGDGSNSLRYTYGNSTNFGEFDLDSDINWGNPGDLRSIIFNPNGSNTWWSLLNGWITTDNTAFLQISELGTTKVAIFKINNIYLTSGKWRLDVETVNTPTPNTIIVGKLYSVSWSLNGAQGLQGYQGFQGSGVQGLQGGVGIQGLQGIIGYQGAQGSIGIQGLPGTTGIQGHQGLQGIIGYQGYQGVTRDNYIISPLSVYNGNQKVGLYNPQTNKFNWVALEGQTTNSDGYPADTPNFYKITLYVENIAIYTNNSYDVSINNWIFDASPYSFISGKDNYLIVEGGGTIPPTRLNSTYYGETGFQGYQGAQGSIGFQGAQGMMGPIGPQGQIGLNGLQGFQGNDGVIGLQGVQGPRGLIGFQGNEGTAGSIGTQGLQGIIGPNGTQGFQGTQGSGFQGVQGSIGSNGIQGTQGAQGSGIQGFQGSIGSNGIQGAQGSSGSGVNIYNTDGSLTGNRIVNVLDYNLSFTNGTTITFDTVTLRAVDASSNNGVNLKMDLLANDVTQSFQTMTGKIEVIPDGTPTLAAGVGSGGPVTTELDPSSTNKFGKVKVTNTGGTTALSILVTITYSTPYPTYAYGIVQVVNPSSYTIKLISDGASELKYMIDSLASLASIEVNYLVMGH